MRVDRLFEILYIIMDKKTVTAKELAERFEISTRTVYRDLEVLSLSGVPIYATKGKGGGIRLIEDYVFDKSLLSDSQKNEILIGLQSLKAARFPEIDKTLSLLSSFFNKQNINWIDVDFSNWANINSEHDKFNVIKNAIINGKVVSFHYHNQRGEKTVRNAEPVQLLFKDHSWYLRAYCLLKKEMRLFKLNRIMDLAFTGEIFAPRIIDKNEDIKTDNSANNIIIKLLFSEKVAYRVYDEFQHSAITVNPDGSLISYLNCPYDNWVHSYILSFLEHVEILEPEYVKIDFAEKIKTINQKYMT